MRMALVGERTVKPPDLVLEHASRIRDLLLLSGLVEQVSKNGMMPKGFSDRDIYESASVLEDWLVGYGFGSFDEPPRFAAWVMCELRQKGRALGHFSGEQYRSFYSFSLRFLGGFTVRKKSSENHFTATHLMHLRC